MYLSQGGTQSKDPAVVAAEENVEQKTKDLADAQKALDDCKQNKGEANCGPEKTAVEEAETALQVAKKALGDAKEASSSVLVLAQ